MAEQFDVQDASGRSVTAIRARERDGNVAEPAPPAEAGCRHADRGMPEGAP